MIYIQSTENHCLQELKIDISEIQFSLLYKTLFWTIKQIKLSSSTNHGFKIKYHGRQSLSFLPNLFDTFGFHKFFRV